MKEIGKPFIKPDRRIRRVFLRYGLIGKGASSEEIVEIGKDMAKEVKKSPCVVDYVMWTFGKLEGMVKCPKCHYTEIEFVGRSDSIDDIESYFCRKCGNCFEIKE